MTGMIRTALLAASAALLAACGGDASEGTDSNATMTTGAAVSADESYLREDDYIMGSADAPVVVLEYASVACPACAVWQAQVYPEFKEKYVDTGKVRYVFRPFPTNPIAMADTGHMLAYCGAREDYYTNIKLQFDRQRQLMDMLQRGNGREAYVSLAAASGLSEEEFVACLQNEEIRERYDEVVQEGSDLGVRGTPSFFINGERFTGGSPTLENLEKVMLPLLGEPVPEADGDSDGSE